jgi:hypothetical protein
MLIYSTLAALFVESTVALTHVQERKRCSTLFLNPPSLYSSSSFCHFIALMRFTARMSSFSRSKEFFLYSHMMVFITTNGSFCLSLILDSNYMKPILSVVAVAIELSITLGCVMSLKNKSQAVRCNLLPIYVYYFDNI